MLQSETRDMVILYKICEAKGKGKEQKENRKLKIEN
jgi:hypothetical protein